MLKTILIVNWGLGLEIVKSLESLGEADILCVITQHDRNTSDKWQNVVYEYAVKKKHKVIDQKEIGFKEMRDLVIEKNIDLILVHSYTKKIPLSVFSVPSYGSVNIHPSLLPKYRGLAPSAWVLKNKDRYTGLTSHYIDEGFDTGNVIAQLKVSVASSDTVETIIEKEKPLIRPLLEMTFSNLKDRNFKARPQNEADALYAPRVTEEEIK